MKVHPEPRKRNIALRYDIASSCSQASGGVAFRQKKLRRLPHVFAKVLELPFHSEADVLVEESSDSLRFVVSTDDIGDDYYDDEVGVRAVEIYPGVTKIVVARGNDVLDLSVDALELDLWRFRLPESTRPELATAAYSDGELVVTVPKGADGVDHNDDIGAEQIVLVHY